MNILTFDIEDWFHLLDVEKLADPRGWEKLESRVENSTLHILDLLSKYNHKATFFVLGYVAEKFPELIMEISKRGHEIGTHSYNHPLLYNLNEREFDYDLRRSIDVISNVINADIYSYRAPGFSLQRSNYSFLKVMREAGIRIDASIFPAKRAHGGIPGSIINEPSILNLEDGLSIIEMPMSPIHFFGQKLIVTGGGYFRITPTKFIENIARQDDYTMWYFHPRDFDYCQPRIDGLGIKRYFKAYVGLKTSSLKFEALLKKYRFVTIEKYLNECPVTRQVEALIDH